MAKVVIGHNPAANMLPMFYFLDRSDPRMDFVTDVPTGHNRLLAEGKIDMAPVSAFSFGEHWKNYSVLADLSVSAKGKIRSILLYSKRDIHDLDGCTIALTNASATSVNLLKIILHKFYKVRPTYVTMAPQLEVMLEKADAALLIGDEALMGLSMVTGCKVYDLAEEWLNHTGQSMTFALWAVRSSLVETHPEDVAHVHRKLLESKSTSLNNMDKIIDRCITDLGNDYDFWQSYFSYLKYDLTPDLLKGLNTYFANCVELGLLSEQPMLKIFG